MNITAEQRDALLIIADAQENIGDLEGGMLIRRLSGQVTVVEAKPDVVAVVTSREMRLNDRDVEQLSDAFCGAVVIRAPKQGQALRALNAAEMLAEGWWRVPNPGSSRWRPAESSAPTSCRHEGMRFDRQRLEWRCPCGETRGPGEPPGYRQPSPLQNP